MSIVQRVCVWVCVHVHCSLCACVWVCVCVHACVFGCVSVFGCMCARVYVHLQQVIHRESAGKQCYFKAVDPAIQVQFMALVPLRTTFSQKGVGGGEGGGEWVGGGWGSGGVGWGGGGGRLRRSCCYEVTSQEKERKKMNMYFLPTNQSIYHTPPLPPRSFKDNLLTKGGGVRERGEWVGGGVWGGVAAME